MTEFPQDGTEQIRETERGARPARGKPSPPERSKAPRVLLWILIFFCATFVVGYGGYGIYLTVSQHLEQNAEPKTAEEGAASGSAPEPKKTVEENPVGAGTDPDFAGLTLQKGSSETLSAGEIFKNTSKSVVQLRREMQDGSVDYNAAVILTKSGYLLTTAHAVGFSRESVLTAVTSDGQELPAAVVGYDSAIDTAVLKVSGKNLQPAELGKADSVSVGNSVYAVFPGAESKYNGVLTRGIVSAKNRTISYDSVGGDLFFQTDAAVGFGGSGSALVNSAGQVIGINVSSAYLGDDYPGESYAISVEEIASSVKDLIRQGYVSGKVRLGISGSTLTESEASLYHVPRGVAIVSISEESAFSGTEAKIGDIITEIDGKTVTSMADVAPILKKHKAGDKVKVRLYRVHGEGDSEELEVTAVLIPDEGGAQN